MDNSGLLNKATNEVEIDKSISKIIVLAAVGVIFSFFFGYFLKLFIIENRWDFFLICLSAALGFLTIFLLDVFFIKDFWRSALIIFLESLAFLSVFYDWLSPKIIGAAFLSFLILLWGNYAGKEELKNMLKIKFWRVGKKVLPKAITGLALFSSVASIMVISLGNEKFFISPQTFEKLISPVLEMKIIQNFFPGIDLSLPIGDLITNLTSIQVEENPQSKLLSPASKQQLINQSANEMEKKISDFVGGPINPKSNTSEVIYESMVNRFVQLPDEVKAIIPIGVAAIIFLTILGFILPIRWLASFLAFLIYEICLALGFSSLVLESKSREIILLQ